MAANQKECPGQGCKFCHVRTLGLEPAMAMSSWQLGRELAWRCRHGDVVLRGAPLGDDVMADGADPSVVVM